jgi:hypothetical protein
MKDKNTLFVFTLNAEHTHREREKEKEKGETNRKEAQKVRSTREENVAIFCREHAVCVYMCVSTIMQTNSIQ